jgi:hypothetical protein
MTKSFSKEKIPKSPKLVTCHACKENFPFSPSVENEYVVTNLQGLKENVVREEKPILKVEFISGKLRLIISVVLALLAMFEGFINMPNKFILLLVFGLLPFLAAYSTLGLLNIPGKALRYTFFLTAILYFMLIFSIIYFPVPEKGLSRALFSSSGSLIVIAGILHIISWSIAKPAPTGSNRAGLDVRTGRRRK